MESYDSVLERMQQTFSGLAGFSADDASDLGIRLKVLAGEVYSLLSAVEWLKGQMFPQTAQQEYLQLHAAQRGLSRKSAVPSAGVLVFGRTSALPYEVLIPKGAVCAAAGEDAPRFVTQQDAILPAGQRTVQTPAVSQQGGKETNAAAGSVTLLLTPPAGVESVSNPQPFTGGADEETDEELRSRLLKSYEVVPNGTNAEFYRSYVARFDGVHSVGVKPRANGSGTVAVYVAGRGSDAPEELLQKIQKELNELREVNVEVTVQPAQPVSVPVVLLIDPAPGCTLQAATQQALLDISAYFESLSVGEPVILAQLGKRLLESGLIRNYQFDSLLSGDAEMGVSQRAVADPVNVKPMGSVV